MPNTLLNLLEVALFLAIILVEPIGVFRLYNLLHNTSIEYPGKDSFFFTLITIAIVDELSARENILIHLAISIFVVFYLLAAMVNHVAKQDYLEALEQENKELRRRQQEEDEAKKEEAERQKKKEEEEEKARIAEIPYLVNFTYTDIYDLPNTAFDQIYEAAVHAGFCIESNDYKMTKQQLIDKGVAIAPKYRLILDDGVCKDNPEKNEIVIYVAFADDDFFVTTIPYSKLPLNSGTVFASLITDINFVIDYGKAKLINRNDDGNLVLRYGNKVCLLIDIEYENPEYYKAQHLPLPGSDAS